MLPQHVQQPAHLPRLQVLGVLQAFTYAHDSPSLTHEAIARASDEGSVVARAEGETTEGGLGATHAGGVGAIGWTVQINRRQNKGRKTTSSALI